MFTPARFVLVDCTRVTMSGVARSAPPTMRSPQFTSRLSRRRVTTKVCSRPMAAKVRFGCTARIHGLANTAAKRDVVRAKLARPRSPLSLELTNPPLRSNPAYRPNSIYGNESIAQLSIADVCLSRCRTELIS